MKKDIDCLIVGYAGVDRIIRIDKPAKAGITTLIQNQDNRRVYFGGNGSNTAICMAKLGNRVCPLMRVGRDWEELGYKAALEDAGVMLDGTTVIPEEITSICHLVEDGDGNHLTMTYPGAMDVRRALTDYDGSLFQRARYGLITVSTYMDVVMFLQKCRQYHLPMVLGVRIDQESFPLCIFRDILHEAKILFMNEVECRLVCEMFRLKAITDLFCKGAADIIVVTLGKNGCEVYEKKEGGILRRQVAATPCDSVVDATGAGDSFIAGFMHGLLRGKSPVQCAEYGSTMSAFVIEQVGCVSNVPTEEQMLARNSQR